MNSTDLPNETARDETAGIDNRTSLVPVPEHVPLLLPDEPEPERELELAPELRCESCYQYPFRFAPCSTLPRVRQASALEDGRGADVKGVDYEDSVVR